MSDQTPKDGLDLDNLAEREEKELFEKVTSNRLLEQIPQPSKLQNYQPQELFALVRSLAIQAAEADHEIKKKSEELREVTLKNNALEDNNTQLRTEGRTRTILAGVTIGCLVPVIIAAAIFALWLKIQFREALSDELIESFFKVLITGLIALPLAVFGYYFFRSKGEKK
jgi:hypothetical protein